MSVNSLHNQQEKSHNKPLHAYSEKEKEEEWHLKAETRYTVRACSQPAEADTKRAYRRYEGVRDEAELKHMTTRYGVEFPAKLTHIPLIKSMILAVLGLKRDQDFPFAVTCRDSKSLDQIEDNRRGAFFELLRQRAEADLSANLRRAAAPPDAQQIAGQQPPQADEAGIKQAVEQMRTWQDELEINGHHLMRFAREKLRMSEHEEAMLQDTMIAGQVYFRCRIEEEGRMPDFMTLDPRRFYFQRSADKRWVRECDRARYEMDMHVTDVINRWGHKMKADERERLLSRLPGTASDATVFDMRLIEHTRFNASPHHFVKVNLCEWKSNNTETFVNAKGELEKRYRLDRYESVLIDSDIFVDMGKAKHIVRPIDNPWYCDLTFDGAIHAIRDGKPQMLVLETADLQDKYDLMFMHWENIVALSGVKAIIMDTADIPKWMGTNPTDRFINWIGYLKQGIAAVDRSVETGNANSKFSNMGEVDLSLDQSVTVILDMIKFLEETASRIVGVPRQMVGQLTQYDGKATSEMAQAGASLVTRPLLSFHQDVLQQAYTAIVNACRYAFRKGVRGAYVLGDRTRRTFKIDGGRTVLADYDVHLSDSGLEQKQLESLRMGLGDLVKGAMVDVETYVDAFTMQSLTEFKLRLKQGIEQQKADKTGQLQQQLEQAMQQLQQLEGKLQQVNEQELQLKAQEVQAKAAHMEGDLEIKRKAQEDNAAFNEGKLTLDKERVRLEGLQMSYSNQSMEVQND